MMFNSVIVPAKDHPSRFEFDGLLASSVGQPWGLGLSLGVPQQRDAISGPGGLFA